MGLRAAAAVAGAALVLVAIAIGGRAGGRITGLAAGLLAATAGASPFIESFTFSGELLAGLVSALSVLALLRHLERGGLPWLALAGVLAGAAVMVKQSAFDAGLVAVALLVARHRRRALAPVGVVAAAALVPVVAAAVGSGDVHAWWSAVVGYGAHASVGAQPIGARLAALGRSAAPAAKALGPAAVLAALAWRRAPAFARVWVAAAALGVVVGGNFHAHYYLQLAVPLSVVGAHAVRALPRRAAVAAVALAAAATVAVAAPLWTAGDDAQARAIWPRDPHLAKDAALAAYVRRHTTAAQPIYVLWAAADLYYLADRRPAYRYLWFRNVQTIRGAVPGVRRLLARRVPVLVVAAQPPSLGDASGRTGAILRRDYRLVAVVEGTRIYRPRRPS